MGGKLRSLLSARRTAIVDRWLERILATYPPETARFLRSESDRFANPVGQTLRDAIPPLVDALLHDDGVLDADLVRAPLDRIVRLRPYRKLQVGSSETIP